jgi:CRP/FNR family cyclic AMP-dependent transcriptional regulator
MHQEILRGLKKIPFLEELSDDTLGRLADCSKLNSFRKHANIITQGDDTHSLYIIISGKVRVFISDEEGKEVTLLIQDAGSYFGELALLCDESRSASVVALEKTTCGIISKCDFKGWLLEHPHVALKLLSELSEKVRYLTEKVKQMALSNVYERTVKILLEMAVPEDGILVIHNRPTQQELASMVGAGREMINKVLTQLRTGGYVVIGEKTMRIEKKLPASW